MSEPKTLNLPLTPRAAVVRIPRPPRASSGRTVYQALRKLGVDVVGCGILVCTFTQELRDGILLRPRRRASCPPPLSTSQSISPRARPHPTSSSQPTSGLSRDCKCNLNPRRSSTLSRDRCGGRASVTRRAHHSARPHTHHTYTHIRCPRHSDRKRRSGRHARCMCASSARSCSPILGS